MKYTHPDIDSSYKENNLGQTLYEYVLKKKPKKIVEIGTLFGYSTVAMAMALDEIGSGHITGYDLFDDYQFKKSTQEQTQENLEKYGVAEYVTLTKKSLEAWLQNPEPFDLLHLDVSNKGDILEQVYAVVKPYIDTGSVMLFEGGSIERDTVLWMKKYGCKKMNDTNVPYEVLDSRFPSISIIEKKNI